MKEYDLLRDQKNYFKPTVSSMSKTLPKLPKLPKLKKPNNTIKNGGNIRKIASKRKLLKLKNKKQRIKSAKIRKANLVIQYGGDPGDGTIWSYVKKIPVSKLVRGVITVGYGLMCEIAHSKQTQQYITSCVTIDLDNQDNSALTAALSTPTVGLSAEPIAEPSAAPKDNVTNRLLPSQSDLVANPAPPNTVSNVKVNLTYYFSNVNEKLTDYFDYFNEKEPKPIFNSKILQIFNIVSNITHFEIFALSRTKLNKEEIIKTFNSFIDGYNQTKLLVYLPTTRIVTRQQTNYVKCVIAYNIIHQVILNTKCQELIDDSITVFKEIYFNGDDVRDLTTKRMDLIYLFNEIFLTQSINPIYYENINGNVSPRIFEFTQTSIVRHIVYLIYSFIYHKLPNGKFALICQNEYMKNYENCHFYEKRFNNQQGKQEGVQTKTNVVQEVVPKVVQTKTNVVQEVVQEVVPAKPNVVQEVVQTNTNRPSGGAIETGQTVAAAAGLFALLFGG
jgi:hypothetical protein